MSKNGLLAAGVLLLVLAALWIQGTGEYLGTDEAAQGVILRMQPDYQPWADSWWSPEGQAENWLFALQGGLGAGFIAYYFYRKKRQGTVK